MGRKRQDEPEFPPLEPAVAFDIKIASGYQALVAKDLFMSAQRFREAADVLSKHISENLELHLGQPYAVVCAFSIELYLKCLLVMERGSYPRDHDLEELFRNLGSGTKGTLTRRFNSLDEKSNRRAAMRKDGFQTDLKTELKRSKDAFELLRYAHEHESKRAAFGLSLLIPCLVQVIFEKQPDWEGIPLF